MGQCFDLRKKQQLNRIISNITEPAALLNKVINAIKVRNSSVRSEMSLTQVVVCSFRSCTTGSTYRRWRGGWLRSNLKIGICWRTTRTWRIDSRGQLISSSSRLLSLRLMIARSLLWLASLVVVVVLMSHYLCPLKIFLHQEWMLVEIDREGLLQINSL